MSPYIPHMYQNKIRVNSIFFHVSTYIARQASSWIDDFIDWSTGNDCCKYFISNNSFCPHEIVDENICQSCTRKPDDDWETYFKRYLSYFIMDNPDANCAKGGHAAYADVSNHQRSSVWGKILTCSSSTHLCLTSCLFHLCIF